MGVSPLIGSDLTFEAVWTADSPLSADLAHFVGELADGRMA